MLHEKKEAKEIKALRLKGRLGESEKRLVKALDEAPLSLVLKKEGYHVYSMSNQWEKALEMMDGLAAIQPEEGLHHSRRGRCLLHLGRPEEAKKAYQRAIMLLAGFNGEQFTEELGKALAERLGVNPDRISSLYELDDGKNNLGVVTHSVEGSSTGYFTKIVQSQRGKEIDFYERILPEYQELKALVPRYGFSLELGGIKTLTVEHINRKPYEKKDLLSFAKAYYSAINQGEAPDVTGSEKETGGKERLLRLGDNRSQGLVRFFSAIHRQQTNEQLFALVHERLKRKPYSGETVELLRELESLIMNKRMYEVVKPERDYTLIHGDLGPHNLLMDEKSRRMYAIDWNTYSRGPRSYDLATLAIKAGTEEIDHSLLETAIDSFLFEYVRIMTAFFGKGRKKFEQLHLEESTLGLKRMKEWGDRLVAAKIGGRSSKRPNYQPNILLFSLFRKQKTPADQLHRAYVINYLSKPKNDRLIMGMLIRDVVKSIGTIPKDLKKQGLKGMDFWRGFYLGFFYGIDGRNYKIQDFSGKSLKKNGRQFITKEEWKYGIYDLLTLYGKRLRGNGSFSLGDKMAFCRFAEEQKFPTVPVLAEVTEETTENPLKALKRDLFIKPRRENEGEGAEAWSWRKEEEIYENEFYGRWDDEGLFKHLQHQAKAHDSGSFLVQPPVEPHQALAFLKIKATPTVRILTYVDPETEEIRIGESMLRYTMNRESIVDNANKGGRVAPVEMETGKAGRPRSSNPDEREEELREAKEVESLIMPYWKECRDLVIRAHEALRYRLVIGWDLLITDEGPLLLEGNSQAGLCFLQRAHAMQVSETEMGEALGIHSANAVKELYSMPEFTGHPRKDRVKAYFGLNKVTRSFIVSGHVQGVGYRNWTRRKFRSLRIQGEVRNLKNGTVEINARGNPFQLQRLYHECHFGPPNARVEGVKSVKVKKSHIEGDGRPS